MNGAYGMESKPNSEHESRPAGADVEVTPEMIAAGLETFFDQGAGYGQYCDAEEVVVSIFRVMQGAAAGSGSSRFPPDE